MAQVAFTALTFSCSLLLSFSSSHHLFFSFFFIIIIIHIFPASEGSTFTWASSIPSSSWARPPSRRRSSRAAPCPAARPAPATAPTTAPAPPPSPASPPPPSPSTPPRTPRRWRRRRRRRSSARPRRSSVVRRRRLRRLRLLLLLLLLSCSASPPSTVWAAPPPRDWALPPAGTGCPNPRSRNCKGGRENAPDYSTTQYNKYKIFFFCETQQNIGWSGLTIASSTRKKNRLGRGGLLMSRFDLPPSRSESFCWAE